MIPLVADIDGGNSVGIEQRDKLSWLLWGLIIHAWTLVITGCTMAGMVGCSGACCVNTGYASYI